MCQMVKVSKPNVRVFVTSRYDNLQYDMACQKSRVDKKLNKIEF